MNIILTPEEILILSQGLRKITELADRSQVISDAIGIDLRSRKRLREIAQKIYNQGSQQARKSRLA